MLARLAHRGPDGVGSIEVGDAWLGHRRLAIVDVAGGQQPLVNAAGDLFLIGNGEIYNHEQLRASLPEAKFRTKSDNEVALHLFEQRGAGAFADLHGMYAFVIAGADGRFVAVRDPVGIKPLYWARRDGQVRFASEMRAFDVEWQPAVETFPPGFAWTPEGGLTRFATLAPLTPRPSSGSTPDHPRRPDPRGRSCGGCASSSSRPSRGR